MPVPERNIRECPLLRLPEVESVGITREVSHCFELSRTNLQAREERTGNRTGDPGLCHLQVRRSRAAKRWDQAYVSCIS